MAGLITQPSIQEVRERANIEEIVGEHVTLRTAGVGSKKGLCPFHDEKSPSFNVRPHHGTYHCFGCGESGDVISFVQRMEHLTFVEAVERLAGRYNVQLQYEEGQRPKDAIDYGSRQRMLQAHALAEGFYADQLRSPEAGEARTFLAAKGFDRSAAATYGVGYAPKGWDALQKFLRTRGFNDQELLRCGLLSEGQRGTYDRFRGRVMWPIRDITGATIGFGARKLFEDDKGPKYLNTPETPIYKKSSVLYGLDLAKKSITGNRRVVVVEGYTDVMAAHLSGVPEAVATCGTAFGDDHVRLVRRLIGDTDRASGIHLATDSVQRGEVIFTFDGDAAGQKAALRAYNDDSKFLAQTYVAVAADGLDPCDLRLQRGDAAVRALIEGRKPLFEFAIHSVLAQVDLDSAEGRIAALRAAAPVVAGIKDNALRGEYARRLSGWLGMDIEEVRRSVGGASKRLAAQQSQPPAYGGGTRGPAPAASGQYSGGQAGHAQSQPGVDPSVAPSANPGANPSMAAVSPRLRDVVDQRDPLAMIEVRALGAVLQLPHVVGTAFDQLPPSTFAVPALRAIAEAVVGSGGVAPLAGQPALISSFMQRLYDSVPHLLHALLGDVMNLPVPARDEAEATEYVRGLLRRLEELALTREITDLRSRLARLQGTDSAEESRQLMQVLVHLDDRKRALRTVN
ncbi:DNA primase [Micrococcales bacterium 31B]|nr:DNA primase [Micrococcales bacterium 31B]